MSHDSIWVPKASVRTLTSSAVPMNIHDVFLLLSTCCLRSVPVLCLSNEYTRADVASTAWLKSIT